MQQNQTKLKKENNNKINLIKNKILFCFAQDFKLSPNFSTIVYISFKGILEIQTAFNKKQKIQRPPLLTCRRHIENNVKRKENNKNNQEN